MPMRWIPDRLSRVMPPPGPARILILGSLLDAAGTGLWMPVSILYFTKVAHLPVAHVALGMSTAGIVGLFGSAMTGPLIRRWGPRRLLMVFSLAQVILTACYSFVDGLAIYLPIVVLAVLAGRSGRVCRNVLIGELSEPDQRVRVRAFTRSVGNAGLSAGVAVAGMLMQVSAISPYAVLLWGNALSFLGLTIAATKLPKDPRRDGFEPAGTGDRGKRSGVFADRPFLVITMLVTVLGTQSAILNIGLPLWLTEQTGAPKSLLAGLMLLNTVMCVLLQVRASSGTDSLTGGVRALRRGGLMLGLACLVYLAAGLKEPVLASVLLIVAVVSHTFGELWQAAGSWGISYALSPPDRLADYQAFFSLVNIGPDVLGPLVVSALISDWGKPGWGVLAVVFCLVAVVCQAVARWAARTRGVSAHPDVPDGLGGQRSSASA